MARKEMDFERMRKDRVRSETGSDMLKFKEGQTLLFFCPPVHDDEPVPYAEGQMHFACGPKKKSVVINLEGSEECEPVLAALEAKGLDWDEAVAGWERAGELVAKQGDPKRQGARNRWWFNVVVLGHRVSSRKPWDVPEPKVQILPCGKKIYDGVTDVFFDEGDITNPDEAIFVIVKRTGTGLDTEYGVKADTDSLKKPVKLDDELWDVVDAALIPGKGNDLHAHLVSMVRTADQIEAMWYGEDDAEEEEAPKRRKAKVTSRPASSRRRRKADDEDDEEPAPKRTRRSSKPADDDEEEAPPKKRTRRSSKKVEEPEPEDPDDEEEEGEEEGEEEVEEAPPKKRTRRRTKAPAPADDSDDGEEAPPKKRTRRTAKKVEEPADDSDDEGGDDEGLSNAEELDAELARRASKPKRRRRTTK